ncbi:MULTISPECIES: hypothetical protein [unclassified Pseudomonas]|uniref:hypothetical protein n=1 Tax=unclassified Pseudomonas TaxID=196821 RepID=UPI00289301B7|nr:MULTISPECIES: hypothetical protein [unclassified Pseudomonas]
MERADNTLAADVENALNDYLALAQDATDKTHQAKLVMLQKKVAAATKAEGVHEHDQVKQFSLAVQTCSLQPTKVRQLQALNLEKIKALNDEIKVRNDATLTLCKPMSIRFQDRTWSQYYSGTSNIKYPDVSGMLPHVCEAGLIQNMMLFDLLQGHRQQICSFQLPDLSALDDDHTDYPAIIIPSGGKDGRWQKMVAGDLPNYWWARFVNQVHVVFLVSNEEIGNYDKIKEMGVTVVGYDGFGMGCARAVGVHVAKKLNRLCFMTDDRTKDLWYRGEPVELGLLELMPKGLQPRFPFISGVSPKGELNILTIINPATTEAEKPNFSRYFIASKEDKGLFLYCEALRLRNPLAKVGALTGNFEETVKGKPAFPFQFEVKYDGDNPAYTNKAVAYAGFKGACMARITDCQLYRSVDTPPGNIPANGVALDWKYLSTHKGFLNQWDAVKMQDSAMYLLLKQIYDEMKAKSESVVEEDKLQPEHWQAFDKYLTPWFS